MGFKFGTSYRKAPKNLQKEDRRPTKCAGETMPRYLADFLRAGGKIQRFSGSGGLDCTLQLKRNELRPV